MNKLVKVNGKTVELDTVLNAMNPTMAAEITECLPTASAQEFVDVYADAHADYYGEVFSV